MRTLSDDRDLYRIVDEVLYYVWDPIGIACKPLARDEYYGYVPTVFLHVRDGSDAETIAAYLGKLAVDGMGLQG